MYILKTENTDHKDYHEVTTTVKDAPFNMTRTYRTAVYYPRVYRFPDGEKTIVAGDETANILLNTIDEYRKQINELSEIISTLELTTTEQLDRKNNIILANTEHINREEVEKKRIELAKKQLKEMEKENPEAIELMKKVYRNSIKVGGDMKKYDTFLDCWLYYYTK